MADCLHWEAMLCAFTPVSHLAKASLPPLQPHDLSLILLATRKHLRISNWESKDFFLQEAQKKAFVKSVIIIFFWNNLTIQDRLCPSLSLLNVRMVCGHYLVRQCSLPCVNITFDLMWIWRGLSLRCYWERAKSHSEVDLPERCWGFRNLPMQETPVSQSLSVSLLLPGHLGDQDFCTVSS